MSSSKNLRGGKAAMASTCLGVLVATTVIGCSERVPTGPADDSSGVCASDELRCSGSCIDPQTDPNNCGVCGVVCASGTCTEGACEFAYSCSDTTFQDRYSPGYTAERDPNVDSLLASMDINDKAMQMSGVDSGPAATPNYQDIQRTFDVEVGGTNIRGYYFRDGPRGVNLEARQHNRERRDDYSTAFPAPVAQGASFDLDLLFRVGEAMGDETVASRNTMLLLPCMNILRHPYWGRAQETFGEDTWHVGRIASAITAGLQTYTAACAKHYTANNIEEDRFNEVAHMNEQTLRETYLGHFEMVVKEGGVACIMAAYNSVSDPSASPVTDYHCTQNRHLLRDILKDEWGFRGFVLSDWWAQPPGQFGISSDTSALQDNARLALEAGLDCEVPWNLSYGTLDTIAGPEQDPTGTYAALVNEAAGRILEQKYRFNAHNADGAYGPRTPTTRLDDTNSITDNESHLDLAQELAARSMVLLKNDNGALPLAESSTVAVVGGQAEYYVLSDCGYNPDNCTPQTLNFATDIRTGDRGSSRVKSNPAQSVAPLEGIRTTAGRHGATVTSDPNTGDAVVVVVGLTAQDEGEEYTGASDRTSFALNAKSPAPTGQPSQDDLIQQTAQAAHGRGVPIVVVIVSGSVISMPWLDQVDAVIMAWYPGQVGGAALGDLLFGDENFSGKLPVTWATNEADWPTFDEGQTTDMAYYVGYKWFDINGRQPTYPWGHGLSYSTFGYSNIRLDPADCGPVTHNAVVGVEVDITNNGDVPGEEVAFLFVSWPNTARQKSFDPNEGIYTNVTKAPIKELKGFVRTDPIAPGETVTATIPLRVADLKYWDMATNAWEIEPGQVDLMVGPSSDDLPLTTSVTVE